MYMAAEAIRKEDLDGERSSRGKEVRKVEDTNLSAGREVNCAF